MSKKVLEKVYDPRQVENKWYDFWTEHRLFHANASSDKSKYTIMIPPPNVTGMLTMGHILNNTVQDLLIRWKKMEGFETLWMPGTDRPHWSQHRCSKTLLPTTASWRKTSDRQPRSRSSSLRVQNG